MLWQIQATIIPHVRRCDAGEYQPADQKTMSETRPVENETECGRFRPHSAERPCYDVVVLEITPGGAGLKPPQRAPLHSRRASPPQVGLHIDRGGVCVTRSAALYPTNDLIA